MLWYAVEDWTGGQEASAKVLAIGYYLNGKMLREYSTLDTAGSPRNVSQTRSHYRVITSIGGYRSDSDYLFDVTTADGRTLSSDVRTGEIVAPSTKPAMRPEAPTTVPASRPG